MKTSSLYLIFFAMIVGALAIPSRGETQEGNVTILYPSNDVVKWNVHVNDIGVDVGNLPAFGYTRFIEDGTGRWIWVTEDYFNLRIAMTSGGTIILMPGTYRLAGRTLWDHASVPSLPCEFLLLPDINDIEINDDVEIRGAGADDGHPTTRLLFDRYIALATGLDEFDPDDPTTWEDADKPRVLIENIHFDNQFENVRAETEYDPNTPECLEVWTDPDRPEWWYFNPGFWSSTSLGHIGISDISITGSKFTGGGATFHAFGSLAFEENVMADTSYGIGLVSYYSWCGLSCGTANADLLIAQNKIKSYGTGIYVAENGFGVSTTARNMEVVGNEVESKFAYGGIVLERNVGTPVVRHNKISVDYVLAGIAAFLSDSAVVESNDVNTLAAAIPPWVGAWSGVALLGSRKVQVKSNKLSGSYLFPIWVSCWDDFDEYASYDCPTPIVPSESNVFTGNNISGAIPEMNPFGLPESHIFFDVDTYSNSVYGGSASSSNTFVLDLGTGNLVSGRDKKIGAVSKYDPLYAEMKGALKKRLAELDW